jgi:hypothetical protein
LGLGFDGEAGPGNRIQAGLGDVLAGQFANPIGVPLDSLERFLDLVNGVLIGREKTQGEVAIKIVGA